MQNRTFPLRFDLMCPECGRRLMLNVDHPIMLVGNVLLKEKPMPKYRYECADCYLIVASDVDERDMPDALAQWDHQNKLPPF